MTSYKADEGRRLWSRLGSNQRPPACEAGALPLSYETGAERRTRSKIARANAAAESAATDRITPRWVVPRDLCGPVHWTIVVLRTGRRSRLLRADVAQLVAHHLAKVRVAGSNPVIRSRVQMASTPAVEWPSGEATACKAVHTGSIPVSTSNFVSTRAVSSAGERFPDTEEVAGSIPVPRTRVCAVQARYLGTQISSRALNGQQC